MVAQHKLSWYGQQGRERFKICLEVETIELLLNEMWVMQAREASSITPGFLV